MSIRDGGRLPHRRILTGSDLMKCGDRMIQKGYNGFIKIGIWRTKLMKSESIIKGVSIGISTAILWSIVLNSKVAGIGVGICLGISLAISDSLISSKKDKDKR